MARWRLGADGWTARCAALLFAVQALLLGFSLGASADVLPRDQFGNVLCLPGSKAEAKRGTSGPEHHARMLECCSLGCAMFGGTAAPQPTSASLPLRRAALSEPLSVVFEGFGPSAPETARRTRGPPAKV